MWYVSSTNALSSDLLKIVQCQFVDEVQVLQADLLNLRKRANTLNSPSTFSEYAKVKREITKKTEQLKQLMGT